MPTPHLYAEILRAIADGVPIQRYSNSAWLNISAGLALNEIARQSQPIKFYRIKPPTIVINEEEVPKPETKPLHRGTSYWVPMLCGSELTVNFAWSDSEIDHFHLDRGLIHLTKADAETHAHVLFSFTNNLE